jgi:hypothetical protein
MKWKKFIKAANLKCIALLATFLCGAPLVGQNNSVMLTPRFIFSSGVYLTLDAVQHNRPDYRWREMKASLATNPESGLARVAFIRPEAGGANLPLDSIYAIGRDSLLYLRLEDDSLRQGVRRFAALLLQGRICVYRLEREEVRMLEMYAYNPATGRPFRKAKVPRKEYVEVLYLFDFSTGDRAVLNRDNLFRWVAEDAFITESIKALSSEELDFIRIIETFNRRHPVYFYR